MVKFPIREQGLFFSIILMSESTTYSSPPAATLHQPFAVISTTAGFRATYDANGNMTLRAEMSGTQRITYTQAWDVENRLAVVTNTVTGAVAQFYYDGDGKRVKKIEGGQTTVCVGAQFEKNVTTGVATTYYFVGSQRVAMRQGITLTYLYGDHLGSTSLATDASGVKIGELRYLPYGGTRQGYPIGNVPTGRRFTGQLEDSYIKLYQMGARWYDSDLGRWISPDSIVPQAGNPQTLNRYSYVNNRPLNYTDPSGHCPVCAYLLSVAGNTIVDVVIDWGIAQLTGEEFVLADSLKVNGAINLVTAGIGGKISKLRHVGKLAGLADNVVTHSDDAAKLIGKVTTRAAGKTARKFVQEAAEAAEERVLRGGLSGSLDAARAAAARGDDILPGLFKYTDPAAVTIPGYQKHHLWPEALGGPKQGWSVYAKDYHAAAGGIQDKLNNFLRGQLGMAQRELEAWSRQNPDRLLPYLRDFYKQAGIDFPY